MPNYKWLNVLAKVINGKTYIFCSCRDIYNDYSMKDTYTKTGNPAGLIAKMKYITKNCKSSSNPDVQCIDLFQFKTIANIECQNASECLKLCRTVSVVLKNFYVNGFGGVAVPGLQINYVQNAIEYILVHCIRKKDQSLVEVLGKFNNAFRDKTTIRKGKLYIIDNNQKSTKVGCSNNPIRRLCELKTNHELYPNASIYSTYETDDVEGVEASAHAILNDWKSQNPYYATNRNSNYGLLDEHFSCPPCSADYLITSALSAYFYETKDNTHPNSDENE